MKPTRLQALIKDHQVERSEEFGSIAAIWRYPVKSMQGEELGSALLTERGVVGDRAYAVLDRSTGHIASAKHPAKWAQLLACRAVFATPPVVDQPLPPVWITLPDATVISSADSEIDHVLSRLVGRAVSLISQAPPQPTREADRTPPAESVRQIQQEPLALAAPAGTFFDYAPLHLLTTATLARLGELYPAGRFDLRRFRPNLVIDLPATPPSFAEQGWLGQTITLGAVRLHIIDPAPRCVVTTLAQADLVADPDILRTLAQHSAAPSATLAPGVMFPAVAGVYGRVIQSGQVERAATVRA